jgi:hypothetical protein
VPLLDDRDGVIGDMARVVRVPGTLNHPNKKKLSEGRDPKPFLARIVREVEDWQQGYSLGDLRAAILARDPGAFDRPHAGSTSDPADFDWNRRKKPGEPAYTLTAEQIARALSKEGDRSKSAATFIRRCWKANYSAEEIADAMLKYGNLPVMGHYSGEATIRADVQRIIGKPDPTERPAGEAFAPIIAASGAEEPASEPGGNDGELILSPAAPLKSAAAFIERKHTLRDSGHTLLHFEDGFYLWHGSHWAEADTKATKKALTEFLASAKTQGPPDKEGQWPEPVPFVPRQKIVDEALYFLTNGTHLAGVSPPCWIGEDAPPTPSGQPSEIISCKNGLLHLPTRTLSPHTPRLFNLNALPFAFDPDAARPARWHDFLKSLWPDDQAAIDTLQEIFGLMLTGDTSYENTSSTRRPITGCITPPILIISTQITAAC